MSNLLFQGQKTKRSEMDILYMISWLKRQTTNEYLNIYKTGNQYKGNTILMRKFQKCNSFSIKVQIYLKCILFSSVLVLFLHFKLNIPCTFLVTGNLFLVKNVQGITGKIFINETSYYFLKLIKKSSFQMIISIYSLSCSNVFFSHCFSLFLN